MISSKTQNNVIKNLLLSGLLLVAALVLASQFIGQAFVTPGTCMEASKISSTGEGGRVGAVASGLVVSALLAGVPPALADQPTYPGWPFAIVFFGLVAVIFIIPSLLFPGKK